jgi:aminomethyltransferase
MSPSINQSIGMGYVKQGFYKDGTEIFIRIRKKLVKAHITKLPFYKG